MTYVAREGEGGTNDVLPVPPVPPLSSPSADVPLDPDLAARLRDLADARIRAEVALAAQLREAAAELRALQARRRRYGVGLRNAAREARIRLTENHNQTEENQK